MNDNGGAIAVDSQDNVYVGGAWNGVGYMTPYYEAFLRKYDSAWNVEYTDIFGAANANVKITVMCVDAEDSVIVGGTTLGSLFAQYNGSSNQLSGTTDIFVRKYFSNGTVHWSSQFGAAEGDEVFAIAPDASGNVYVGGRTLGNVASVVHGYCDALLCIFSWKYKLAIQRIR